MIEALKTAYEMSGIRLFEWSKHSGISEGHISRILNGQYSPTLRTLESLKSGLGEAIAERQKKLTKTLDYLGEHDYDNGHAGAAPPPPPLENSKAAPAIL